MIMSKIWNINRKPKIFKIKDSLINIKIFLFWDLETFFKDFHK